MSIHRVLCAAFVALIGVSCAHAMHASRVVTGDARIDADLDRLRAATRSFQVLDSAVAAGYPREVPQCLIHEHHGAMGYHHVNRALFTAKPDVEHPQILLYERKPDGAYKLNAVEFIVPYALYARDSAPPMLMGQKLHHEDNLNIWYLHVWAWSGNPEGVFANFNPNVTCPKEAAKVYTPFSRDG